MAADSREGVVTGRRDALPLLVSDRLEVQIRALSPSRRKKTTRKPARMATVTPLAMEAAMLPAAVPAVALAVSIASWTMVPTMSGTAASLRADRMALRCARERMTVPARGARRV